jgi:hypothetical protein
MAASGISKDIHKSLVLDESSSISRFVHIYGQDLEKWKK